MKNSAQLFASFESNGIKALEILRNRALAPNTRKELRTWGITDACKMIGRSVQTIRDLEKEGKLPPPGHDNSSNRRFYTLSHINQLRDYFGTRPKKPDGAEPTVFAIANFKGGVWKTSTAVNTAQALALKGYRVLLIDADSQGSTTQSFDYIPDTDISENETLLPLLLGEINDIRHIIRKTYWDGLDLIPANLALYNAEFVLPVKTMEFKSQNKPFAFYDLLRPALKTIKDDYDIIVLDCPPSMGMISINAIYAADSLLIPIPPLILDFSSTIQFFGMIKDVLKKLPQKEYNFIRFLITKYESVATSSVLEQVIRKTYGEFVMSAKMPMSEAIKKAGVEMLSIYEVEFYSGSKKTFDRIKFAADEVCNEIEISIKKSWENPNQIGESTNV